MAKRCVVLRADASSTIGAGHLMRCLALADELRARGFECHFVSRPSEGGLLGLVSARGHTVHALRATASREEDLDEARDAADVCAVLELLGPSCVVVDHYQLSAAWEAPIRAHSALLLAIDDIGRAHSCDLLLDQNFRNPAHARYELCAPGAQL